MTRILAAAVVLLFVVACQTPQPAPTGTPIVQVTPTPGETTIPIEPTSEPTTEPTVEPTEQPATPSPATPEPTTAPGTRDVYVDVEGGLNLRAEASASATLLRLLPPGTHLTALGDPTGPDASGISWQNVRTDDGQAGWVASQFLTTTQPGTEAPAPSPTPSSPIAPGAPAVEPGYVYVASTGGLNLRERASASSALLTTLANGQRLQTNELAFGPDSFGITWLNVKTEDEVEGWVAVEFISTEVPSVAPADPPANVPDIVAEIFRRTNELRQQNGLLAFVLNDTLTQLALSHSQYMAQNGITHIGPGGLSAKHRIANAGYGFGTENIYGGEASIDDAWEYWASDPPHRDNLLHPTHTVVGIGVYQVGRRTYYTMDFGRPD